MCTEVLSMFFYRSVVKISVISLSRHMPFFHMALVLILSRRPVRVRSCRRQIHE